MYFFIAADEKISSNREKYTKKFCISSKFFNQHESDKIKKAMHQNITFYLEVMNSKRKVRQYQ